MYGRWRKNVGSAAGLLTFYVLLLAKVSLAAGGQADQAQSPPPPGKHDQRSVYVGAAFNMMELGKPGAEGWQEVRDSGAKLHVHPTGWRGQWDKIGPAIRSNFQTPYFLYEFDIVDPRNGVNNLEEISKVEAFGMICEAAFCNVDGREMLNNRDQLISDYRSMVSNPLKRRGIFLYFTFSPVASPEVVERMPELLEGNYWLTLAKECGADGIGLDFPCSYWRVQSYRERLVEFIRGARENGLPVLIIDSITSETDIEDLAEMYAGLEIADALPDAWNMGQFHGPSYALVPEQDPSGLPSGTATGAALWLFRHGFGKK